MCNSVVPITIQWWGVILVGYPKRQILGASTADATMGGTLLASFEGHYCECGVKGIGCMRPYKAASKHQPVSLKWSNPYIKKVHKMRFHWVIRWVTLRNNCLQIQHAFKDGIFLWQTALTHANAFAYFCNIPLQSVPQQTMCTQESDSSCGTHRIQND